MVEVPVITVYDAIVVGAGLAGLAAALGLARAGLKVASVGRVERGGPGRTVALLGRSVDFLQQLGVRAEVEEQGAPLCGMRIVDDSGSIFAPRPVTFRAREIGLEAFGWNIENARLAPILESALAGVARFEAEVARFDLGADVATLTLTDGATLATRLVVGADGRNSPSRKAAGIEATVRGFGQTALTLQLRHTRDHDDVSTEFHTREGPFTLVPLPPAPGAPHRSSLVWLMRDATYARIGALDDAALLREIHRHAHGFLGEMEVVGAHGAFAMNVQRVSRLTGPRLALIGDAAHAFPPIGAQGLNLGLRDAQTLVAQASRATDPGDAATLAAYAAARRPDILTRTLGVGLLNMSLLAGFGPIDAARGLGLAALGAFRPLRRLAMREGLNPFLGR